MTAPRSAATTFIPTTRVAYALTYATCDGSGLITVPTADGPEHGACDGCTACTRPAGAPAAPDSLALRRARAFAAATSRADDDEPW